MKKRRIFRNLNDKEFAWVLYDVGNSAYTMLACALIPIWFKAMAIGTKPGQLTSDRATAYYSMAIAVITIVVALLGPVCGAISDYKGMKKDIFYQYRCSGRLWMHPEWICLSVDRIFAPVCSNQDLLQYVPDVL